MSEREQQILKTLADVIPKLSENEKTVSSDTVKEWRQCASGETEKKRENCRCSINETVTDCHGLKGAEI